MATVPADKSAEETLAATEVNKLRDIGYLVSLLRGETINGATTPVPVYISSADGKVYACDGNDQAKLEFQGFVIDSGASGAAAQLQMSGIVGGFTGLTAGAAYYVQDAVGTIGTTVGTYGIYVGVAVSTTQILIDKGPRAQMQYMGSAAESAGSIAVPTGARFAIIKCAVTSAAGDGGRNSGVITLAKNGITSASSTSKAATGAEVGTTASWSGSSITITYTGAATLVASSATAYFYR